MAREQVPLPLQSWIKWVLHGHEQRACPFLNGRASNAPRVCAWPSRLELELDDAGGSFRQHWQLHADAEVALPGDTKHWPLDVTRGQQALAVRDAGAPRVRLPTGEHVVSGRFAWSSLPELLQIPRATGIVSLSLRGQAIANPRRDAQGRLWLQKRASQAANDESRVQVVVHRRVVDEIPLRLITRVELRVSGAGREVVFDRALPGGFVPMSLRSPLPARVDPDGSLRVQVRPGTWVLELDARHDGPARELTAPSERGEGAGAEVEDLWDRDEVWVFEARPQLRRVEIEGGTLLDPSRTTLPQEWRRFPAYLMQPGQSIRLVEQRRGDANPAPDSLHLQRELWLDFDGAGYTLRDEITGEIRRSSRLEVRPGIELGRASLNGEDQVITRLEGSASEGIESPRGSIRIAADSRTKGDEPLSAVGWDHDFESLAATLHLPPGWRLFHASGVDRATSTWLNRWTLLDLFFVFVIAIAVFRLCGPLWGGLALVTLTLSYTEPAAPQMAWIAVLIGEGLSRAGSVLGRFDRYLRGYRFAAMITLVLVAIPFGVREVRVGIYPALAHQAGTAGFEAAPPPGSPAQKKMEREAPQGLATVADAEKHTSAESFLQFDLKSSSSRAGRSRRERRYALDPNAAVTTGPGLPNWSWERVSLAWSGPVERTQQLGFVFIPPWLNRLLAFLRVALVAALVARLLWSEVSAAGARFHRSSGAAVASGLFFAPLSSLLFALSVVGTPSQSQAYDVTPEVLAELRERLLASPDCHPQCASIPRLAVDASGTQLTLRIEVDLVAGSAVPLPGGARSWLPAVVSVDGAETSALHRSSDGVLWINLAAGRHQIVARGPLGDRDQVDLPLPMRPHHVVSRLRGWELHGVHEDGEVESNLRLSRLRDAQTGSQRGARNELDPGEIPPFVRVVRSLELDLEWRLTTRVVRMTPDDRAVVLEVPLLEGEDATTDRIRVEAGKALVSMAPGESEVVWTSTLEQRPELVLRAPDAVPWIETWRLDVNPIWHVDAVGIPPIHQPSAAGARQQEWRPWPGEQVVLSIRRPAAVPGPTLTIDASKLVLQPGLRSTDAELRLRIRSSRGAEHVVTLPEGGSLQRVEVGGVALPVRQQGRKVVLNLRPGSQDVMLRWQEPRGIGAGLIYRSSVVALGAPSVNAEVEIRPSVGRWILLVGGPRLGPAVLFWSLLFVLAGVAYGLGRVPTTPLRFPHWLLLGVGLTQVSVPAAAIVVAWLLALGWRRERAGALADRAFDLLQILLVVLSVTALVLLLSSIERGLLGNPEMQIAGNGSSAEVLIWYRDRILDSPPDCWVLSVPIVVYRLAMLAWALWIAQAVVGWLRWGWECMNEGGLWRPFRKQRTDNGVLGSARDNSQNNSHEHVPDS